MFGEEYIAVDIGNNLLMTLLQETNYEKIAIYRLNCLTSRSHLYCLCFALIGFVQKIGHRDKKKNSSENPLFAANTEFSSTTGMGGALFTSNKIFFAFLFQF